MGQGRGDEGKKEVKKVAFPTLMTMIVASNDWSLQENSQSERAYYCSHIINVINESFKSGWGLLSYFSVDFFLSLKSLNSSFMQL